MKTPCFASIIQPITRRLALLAVVPVAILFSGCEHTTQTTSGKRYLDKYPPTRPGETAQTGPIASNDEVDQLVAEVAAVEPTLQFPARIGLARIENGSLVNIPAIEGEHWRELHTSLGQSFGQFVPINTFVAEMVYSGSGASEYTQSRIADTIKRIRLGAARQHLDAVLIYEVATSSDVRSTGFTILDLTIVGGLARTSRAHAEAYASAMLIDVRNGYPYGTALATSKDERSASTLGSENRLARQRDSVTSAAVDSLTDEVETMFAKLAIELAQNERHTSVADVH